MSDLFLTVHKFLVFILAIMSKSLGQEGIEEKFSLSMKVKLPFLRLNCEIYIQCSSFKSEVSPEIE